MVGVPNNLVFQTILDKKLRFQKGKQKEFLTQVSIDCFGKKVLLSGFLGCHRRTLADWIREKYLLPKSAFLRICGNFNQYYAYYAFVEEELHVTWGASKGGFACSEKADLKSKMAGVRSFIAEDSEEARTAGKQEFFHPLVEEMINENVDLKAILAVCLLTDGALTIEEGTYRICFYSKDEVLRDFSKALISKLSKFKLNVCLGSKDTWMMRVSDKNLAKEMLKLSPDYRTFPPEGCLQPTISFLKNANYQTKKWALKTAFSTDGCISLPKQGRPELNLACYNKSNSEEWKEFLAEFCIKGKLSLGAGNLCRGVRIYDSQSIYNFHKLGGFLDGVKISAKSKNYCGMAKNELLSQIVREFSKRRIKWG